jgi:hypothetical protein
LTAYYVAFRIEVQAVVAELADALA